MSIAHSVQWVFADTHLGVISTSIKVNSAIVLHSDSLFILAQTVELPYSYAKAHLHCALYYAAGQLFGSELQAQPEKHKRTHHLGNLEVKFDFSLIAQLSDPNQLICGVIQCSAGHSTASAKQKAVKTFH